MNSVSHYLEQVAKELAQLPTDQLHESISRCTPEEICSFIAYLGVTHDPKMIEKTRATLLGLQDPIQIEAVGKGMNIDQILDILHLAIQGYVAIISRISQVIIGLNHMVFAQVMNHASVEILSYLKNEGSHEPVQHQLTILSHLLQNHTNVILKEIDFLEHEVQTLPIEILTEKKLVEWTHGVQTYHQKIVSYVATIQNALSIAWHTDRADLVETLSENKEMIQRYLANVIGHPESKNYSATGIYALIERKLFSVYGESLDNNNVEALRDDEPVVEGLVKLGIWDVLGYWEVGLLPKIKTKDDLNSNNGLLAEAKENLLRIGLQSVGDLKRNRIFSKESLHTFVKKHISH